MNSRKRGNATVKCCGLFVWVTVMALTSPLPATAQPGARAAVFTTEQLEQLAAPSHGR